MLLKSISRNDVKAALAAYREAVVEEQWHEQTAESLLMLQDDPDELIRAMDTLERDDTAFREALHAQQEARRQYLESMRL